MAMYRMGFGLHFALLHNYLYVAKFGFTIAAIATILFFTGKAYSIQILCLRILRYQPPYRSFRPSVDPDARPCGL